VKQKWNRLASHCQRDKDTSGSQKHINDYKLLKKKPLTRNYWHYCKQHSPSGNSIQIILIPRTNKNHVRKREYEQVHYFLYIPKQRIAVLHPRSPRSFCMTTFSAIIRNLTVLRLQSYDCTSKVRKTNTGTSTASTTETYWYTRKLLQTCDISLWLPTLPAPKAGDFVEIFHLYGKSLQVFLVRMVWDSAPRYCSRCKCLYCTNSGIQMHMEHWRNCNWRGRPEAGYSEKIRPWRHWRLQIPDFSRVEPGDFAAGSSALHRNNDCYFRPQEHTDTVVQQSCGRSPSR
jgi:hypothetical protein